VTVLTLPARCVVVLVGAAGAGKSTLAHRLFEADEVLSSDAFRAMISGDESDQRVSGRAFRALAAALERRLAAGGRAVVDATNLRPSDRRPWLMAARRHGVPALAVILDPPAEEVRRQGLGRRRVVPGPIVTRHLAAMEVLRRAGLGALRAEGFEVVVRLDSALAVAALSLDRALEEPVQPPDA
jgi:protein phosphatase